MSKKQKSFDLKLTVFVILSLHKKNDIQFKINKKNKLIASIKIRNGKIVCQGRVFNILRFQQFITKK